MSITAPGIYELDESLYQADTELAPDLGRSLSFSGAKTILSSPARFAYQREHGRPDKPAFDFGHAAHLYILGKGNAIVRIDADDWRTKAAKDARAEAYADGLVPLLGADDDRALALAKAVRDHPLAAAILSEGEPEKSIYWVDEATGVTCRGRVDWLRDNALVDVKTTLDASPAAFAKSCANYGYDQQADWYPAGIEAITGKRLPFLFIAVEKEPPHLVAVYQLDADALDRGARRNRQALDLYAECESSGIWPAYSEDIETLSLPRWAY
jgi:hypothetical protein